MVVLFDKRQTHRPHTQRVMRNLNHRKCVNSKNSSQKEKKKYSESFSVDCMILFIFFGETIEQGRSGSTFTLNFVNNFFSIDFMKFRGFFFSKTLFIPIHIRSGMQKSCRNHVENKIINADYIRQIWTDPKIAKNSLQKGRNLHQINFPVSAVLKISKKNYLSAKKGGGRDLLWYYLR